ncbi:HupE/UreJ family protein [Luteolibacter arcticus]|uniref:HupE/UreJ family protein n=1 Tax=Luteolibacter arcticus TaxID=1581411 RepID=A0ABT3GEN3_9BACT|nr:HupE/UreJ family protein [Luteolibacter arcticus]MCW1922064.1 HupE/UreJ family protein [Luteolibacter arcticus]
MSASCWFGRGLRHLGAVLFLLISFARPALAHDEPTSFVDLKVSGQGVDASLVASVTDLAHYMPDTEPAMLLAVPLTEARRLALAELVTSRFKLGADGAPVTLRLVDMVPFADKRDLRLEFHADWTAPPKALRIESNLFPYDTRHRTYLNVYTTDKLVYQHAFENGSPPLELQVGATQGLGEVIREFVYEGIHHIFIGPDHILFVIGLLLLGGSLKHLLKIVTAFTIAHSITLCLATFRVLTPPATVIEPVIALSIVFVGAQALMGMQHRDPRLIFAFCFGLIHGFGFANVLQEMMLPPSQLGWSLFSFNAGVEIGQACIILAVAPLLSVIRKRDPKVARSVVSAAALLVTTAGAFWFFQRILP